MLKYKTRFNYVNCNNSGIANAKPVTSSSARLKALLQTRTSWEVIFHKGRIVKAGPIKEIEEVAEAVGKLSDEAAEKYLDDLLVKEVKINFELSRQKLLKYTDAEIERIWANSPIKVEEMPRQELDRLLEIRKKYPKLKTDNFADLSTQYKDGKITNRSAHSGRKKYMEGSADTPNLTNWETFRDETMLRANDSEVKLILEFLNEYAAKNMDDISSISISTMLEPCASCKRVILAFQELTGKEVKIVTNIDVTSNKDLLKLIEQN